MNNKIIIGIVILGILLVLSVIIFSNQENEESLGSFFGELFSGGIFGGYGTEALPVRDNECTPSFFPEDYTVSAGKQCTRTNGEIGMCDEDGYCVKVPKPVEIQKICDNENEGKLCECEYELTYNNFDVEKCAEDFDDYIDIEIKYEKPGENPGDASKPWNVDDEKKKEVKNRICKFYSKLDDSQKNIIKSLTVRYNDDFDYQDNLDFIFPISDDQSNLAIDGLDYVNEEILRYGLSYAQGGKMLSENPNRYNELKKKWKEISGDIFLSVRERGEKDIIGIVIKAKEGSVYSGMIGKDDEINYFDGPLFGVIAPEGAQWISQDRALFQSKTANDPGFFQRNGLFNSNNPWSYRYKEKLKLLHDYGFISDKEYNNAFKECYCDSGSCVDKSSSVSENIGLKNNEELSNVNYEEDTGLCNHCGEGIFNLCDLNECYSLGNCEFADGFWFFDDCSGEVVV